MSRLFCLLYLRPNNSPGQVTMASRVCVINTPGFTITVVISIPGLSHNKLMAVQEKTSGQTGLQKLPLKTAESLSDPKL